VREQVLAGGAGSGRSTFNALKITRTDTADGSTKTQWFTRGVGKIREVTGQGHTEELSAYTIVPQ